MIGPVRTPSPDRVVPMRNRAGATLPKNRIVGYGTPAATGEPAMTSLHSAGLGKIAGVVQHATDDGQAQNVYRGGDLVVESDGTGAIAYGDKLIAVAGSGVADGGRVAKLPSSPTAGTNYFIVGEAQSDAAASPGAEVIVRWNPETYQG